MVGGSTARERIRAPTMAETIRSDSPRAVRFERHGKCDVKGFELSGKRSSCPRLLIRIMFQKTINKLENPGLVSNLHLLFSGFCRHGPDRMGKIFDCRFFTFAYLSQSQGVI
jgi:hypothetical protein